MCKIKEFDFSGLDLGNVLFPLYILLNSVLYWLACLRFSTFDLWLSFFLWSEHERWWGFNPRQRMVFT
jgi:hypothetical protein